MLGTSGSRADSGRSVAIASYAGRASGLESLFVRSFGLLNLGALRASLPFLGLWRNGVTRQSKTNELAFASPKISLLNIGLESRRIPRSVDGMVLERRIRASTRDLRTADSFYCIRSCHIELNFSACLEFRNYGWACTAG